FQAEQLSYQASNPYNDGGSGGLGGAMASGLAAGLKRGSKFNEIYSRCMESKGYYFVLDKR
ncbi:MAG: hypothetical protein WCX16_04665, partial [Candidatus Omnitrophota bacterium]